MNIVFEVVLPTFVIIALGFFLGKIKKLSIGTLVYIIIYISAPALAFSSIYENQIILNDVISIAITATAVVLGILLIAFVTFKLFRIKHRALYLPMMFGNTGYLGYPVIMFAYGLAGFSRAVLYVIIFDLLFYTIGIYVSTKKSNIKEIFRLPLIYAVIAALIIKYLNVNLPSLIIQPISTLGLITVPVALIVLGCQLSSIKSKSISYGLLGSAYRIGLGFLISVIVVSLLGTTGVTKNVIIVEGAMPAAVMSLIITSKYSKKDAPLTASIVFVSTVLSILTIPLVLWFLS